jgi:hypothetical protein
MVLVIIFGIICSFSFLSWILCRSAAMGDKANVSPQPVTPIVLGTELLCLDLTPEQAMWQEIERQRQAGITQDPALQSFIRGARDIIRCGRGDGCMMVSEKELVAILWTMGVE